MNKTKKISFEDQLKRLEEISILLESDNIKLEDSIHLYEEGIELSKKCTDILRSAELKITEIKKKSNIIPNNDQIIETIDGVS